MEKTQKYTLGVRTTRRLLHQKPELLRSWPAWWGLTLRISHLILGRCFLLDQNLKKRILGGGRW